MKKILGIILGLLIMIPVLKAEEKVKVYVFEAGGCPFCEAQIEYLEGLEGYNKTFEVISKQLYVDHENWAQGKDYELGKSVATVFKNAGFEDARYDGTPFVVISDLYAAATYSTELETIINKAYAEGDKDAVSCIQNGGGVSCIRVPEKEETPNGKGGIVLAILAGIALVGVVIYIAKVGGENTEFNENIEEETKEVKKEKPATKKTTTKTAPKKKTTKKAKKK